VVVAAALRRRRRRRRRTWYVRAAGEVGALGVGVVVGIGERGAEVALALPASRPHRENSGL
jgi:hypothetical protein